MTSVAAINRKVLHTHGITDISVYNTSTCSLALIHAPMSYIGKSRVKVIINPLAILYFLIMIIQNGSKCLSPIPHLIIFHFIVTILRADHKTMCWD